MKSVLISVHTLQRNAQGEEDTMKLVTKGVYEERDQLRILRYDETELTGMDGTTTTIELHPHHLVLIRTGNVLQHQEFHPGKTYRSQYRTPFGPLTLAMHTYELDAQLEQGIGTIRLRYDVALEGMHSNYNELTICSREEENINGFA